MVDFDALVVSFWGWSLSDTCCGRLRRRLGSFEEQENAPRTSLGHKTLADAKCWPESLRVFERAAPRCWDEREGAVEIRG
jgi:hypothetical protein